MRPSVVPMWATVTLLRCVTYSAVTCTCPNSPLNRSTRKRLLLTSRGKWRQLLLGLGASRPGWGSQGRSQGSSPHTDPLRPLSVTIAAQTPTPQLACLEKAPGLPVTAPLHLTGLSEVTRPRKKVQAGRPDSLYALSYRSCHVHPDNELLSLTDSTPFCPHNQSAKNVLSSPPFYG